MFAIRCCSKNIGYTENTIFASNFNIDLGILKKNNASIFSFVQFCTNELSLLFYIIFLLISIPSSAQIRPIKINEEVIITKKHITIKDGLVAREVLCAAEDKDGFIWFGTSNGLNRYDGRNIKLFNKENFGLLHNQIASLTIDNNNHLIIEFNNKDMNLIRFGEIQVIDLNNYSLLSLESIFPGMPFTTKDIIRISNDVNKNLIFVTSNPYQLWKYNISTGFKLWANLTAWKKFTEPNTQKKTDIHSRVIFQNGAVSLSLSEYPDYLITEDTAISFMLPNTERVFGITESKEILVHNNSSGISKRKLKPTVSNQLLNGTMHFSQLITLSTWSYPMPFSDYDCVISNPRSGIFLIEGTSLKLLIDSTELNPMPNFGVYSVFKDKNDNRWICTTDGVIQVNVKKNHFRNYFTKKKEPTPDCNQVRGIYVDTVSHKKGIKPNSDIYASVWNYFCDAKTDGSKMFLSSSKNKDGVNSCLKHQNKIYVGGVDKIFEYTPNQKKLIELNASLCGNIYNYLWSMATATDSTILLGQTEDISLFNIHTKTSTPLNYSSVKIPKAQNVYRFVQTQKKGLVAVAENGLYIIDKNNNIVDYYGELIPDSSHYLPISVIYDLHEDKNEIWWIASKDQGLFRLDLKHSIIDNTTRIKQFTTLEGLSSNILYRIEADEDNNLWIGSYNGLILFYTKNFSSKTFTVDNGLSHNEFNRTSSFKTADGAMYFGGINGVNAFYPKDFYENSDYKIDASFKLIGLTKFSNKEKKFIDFFNEAQQAKKIILEPGDLFLTAEFQLLDFQDRKHKYAYRIIGINDNWNYLDDNFIRISGLPYGEFKLEIKAQTAIGQWSGDIINLPIYVLKPLYLKTWFITSAVFLLIIILILTIKSRTKKLQQQNHQLESSVNKRTFQLTEALKEREILLKEIHHRVKNNLQVIIGLIELQKKELKQETAIKAFSEAQSRIISIALIHQNLYQDEKLGSIEFCSFAKELSIKVANLFENQKNSVLFNIVDNAFFLDLDIAVPLGLILNELLTNSFKYSVKSDRQNEIDINIVTLKNGAYELTYKDNGSGLKAGVDFDTATSLGFELIKGLSMQIGGKASYKFSNGNVFTIFLKIQLEAKEGNF